MAKTNTLDLTGMTECLRRFVKFTIEAPQLYLAIISSRSKEGVIVAKIYAFDNAGMSLKFFY